uniref:Abdominal-B n=1 Tax=Ascaris lumbricoides TaxID=6252 RepID=A0A0M3I9J6_ASCLU
MSRMYPPSFHSSRFDYSMWSPSVSTVTSSGGSSTSAQQMPSSSTEYYQQQQPSTSSALAAGYYPVPESSSRLTNPYYSSEFCNSQAPFVVPSMSRSCQPAGVPAGGVPYVASPYAQYAVQYYQHQHQMQQHQHNYLHSHTQSSVPTSSQPSPYRQTPTSWKYASGNRCKILSS